MGIGSTYFAPELYIRNGIKDISFYEKAFGAIEKFCFRNSDESISRGRTFYKRCNISCTRNNIYQVLLP